jgi:hypothetical protein
MTKDPLLLLGAPNKSSSFRIEASIQLKIPIRTSSGRIHVTNPLLDSRQYITQQAWVEGNLYVRFTYTLRQSLRALNRYPIERESHHMGAVGFPTLVAWSESLFYPS